jgi:GR25 family glycosyltransferase involved in LPS biosynthesis
MISYIVWPNNSRFLVSNLYNPFVPLAHSGTGAYIINREGAKKILDKHNFNTPNLENYTKIRPVADVIIYDLVKTYVYKYCLFTFANDNVSTIHGVGSEQKHEITEHSTKKLARYIYSL